LIEVVRRLVRIWIGWFAATKRERKALLPSYDMGRACVDVNDRESLYEFMGGR